MAHLSMEERYPRAPHGRRLALLALLLGLEGCANMFMAGSSTVTSPPGSPAGKWTVAACEDLAGKRFEVPGGISYYLEQAPAGPVLYEFDAKGNSAKITNHWQDAEGLHFFTYVRTSHAYELVLPENHRQAGKRKVFPRGTYQTSEDASGVVRPGGSPGATCEMTPT